MKQFIVLFDGVCNLCQGSVQFIIKRDKTSQFQFASLQSAHGQALLAKFSLPTKELQSIVLVEGEKCYTHSTAALRIAQQLSGIWKIIGYAGFIVPKPLRDVLYNFIARNRYHWFGKKESCWLPTPELKARFLS
ncbi:MAG: thiol-disulfide oxidoreductase DCC family protein [Cytophagales bacterium]|nr:MAG: thiol-disulfide oxidoreductase DCC family protein [Cytophagales bacterium]